MKKKHSCVLLNATEKVALTRRREGVAANQRSRHCKAQAVTSPPPSSCQLTAAHMSLYAADGVDWPLVLTSR